MTSSSSASSHNTSLATPEKFNTNKQGDKGKRKGKAVISRQYNADKDDFDPFI
jgi:hypothetical protein